MKNTPVRVAIIGMGGCAASHHEALNQLEDLGECKLVATCDPTLSNEALPWIRSSLPVFTCYREMLKSISGNVDYVVVPTPIHLHKEMHLEVIQSGAACYLEKPPTLDPREMQAMLDTERQAKVPSFVGFSYFFRSEIQSLKQRLIQNEFGRILSISFLGLAPKPTSYFSRNKWAGKFRWKEQLLLDSCMGNGLAHHIQTVLFWAENKELWKWSRPKAVKATLFRSNDIQTADTILAEVITEGDTKIRLAMSNTCQESCREETITCESAAITVRYGRTPAIFIKKSGLADEVIAVPNKNAYVENHRWYHRCFKQNRYTHPMQLSECVGLVEANALAYISSKQITPLPAFRTSQEGSGRDSHLVVPEIEDVLREYLSTDAPRCATFPSRPLAEPTWAYIKDIHKINTLFKEELKDSRENSQPILITSQNI